MTQRQKRGWFIFAVCLISFMLSLLIWPGWLARVPGFLWWLWSMPGFI